MLRVKNLGIALLLTAALALGFMAVGSIATMTGCAKKVDVGTAPAPEVETQKHKALRATAGFASGLDALHDIVAKLYDEKLLEAPEAAAIAQGIKDASYVNDEAAAKISAFTDIDASNRAQVTAMLRSIAESVQKLHNEGVLHIKNAQAKERVRLGFAAFNAAMALAESFN